MSKRRSRTAHLRTYIPVALRRSIRAKYDGDCAYCGCVLVDGEWHIDHVVPLRRGGTHTEENLVPACAECNRYKYTLTLEGFRRRITRTLINLRRLSSYRGAVRFGLLEVNSQPIVFRMEIETPNQEEKK